MNRKRWLLLLLVSMCLLSGCEKEESHEKATLVWEDVGEDMCTAKK